MSGRWKVGLLMLLVVGAAMYGVRLRLPQVVPIVELEVRDIQRTLVLVGRVRAPARAGLGSAVSGVVREVRVGEGDRIEAGQLLVRLDDQAAEAAVQEAEATLAEVAAAVRSEIERAEAEAAQAERDLARFRAVYTDGGLTLQRVEEAEQRALDAQSRLQAALAAVDSGGTNASVARARSALAGARARLDLTRVTAPTAGVVLQRLVEVGDAVQPGGVLLDVALDGPGELVAFPSEENLPLLQEGARAVVSADAFPSDSFPARVRSVAPVVDPAQGTIEVRLSVEEPPAYLRPDMTLSVSIDGGARENARVLPLEAVQGLGVGSPWVAIVREGRLERRDVVLGLRGDGFMEILGGVEPGESVAVGPEIPDPGSRIRTEP